ncbi:hypothetical protein VF21_01255 [Pseudogymnoascus sp. 05NY08]|nr:hypothetical protein VF21_01255 [Pseudogymnoascus sp. 05NY08]
MTTQTPTTKTFTPITPTTTLTSQCLSTAPVTTATNLKPTVQNDRVLKSRDSVTKERQEAIQSLSMRAYFARVRRQSLTHDGTGKCECECRDPYKAKRERDRKEARKRKVEREGRRRRWEDLKRGGGRGRGDWRVGEVGRMFEGMVV